jgi:arsenate reductase
MSVDVYGIKNCDTVKKATAWLNDHRIKFSFHDFKTEGVDTKKLSLWMKSEHGYKLMNRSSTTWRSLSEAEKLNAENKGGSLLLMQIHTSLIKRPVVETETGILIGFKAEEFEKYFF